MRVHLLGFGALLAMVVACEVHMNDGKQPATPGNGAAPGVAPPPAPAPGPAPTTAPLETKQRGFFNPNRQDPVAPMPAVVDAGGPSPTAPDAGAATTTTDAGGAVATTDAGSGLSNSARKR